MSMVTLRAEDIPPLSHDDMARLKELSAMPDEQIDFSDIPPLTPEQLSRMRRPGLAHRGGVAKLDREVLDWCLARLGDRDLDVVVNEALRSLMRVERDLERLPLSRPEAA